MFCRVEESFFFAEQSKRTGRFRKVTWREQIIFLQNSKKEKGVLTVTSKIKSLWARLKGLEYRTAYLDESINARLAAQIYSLRVSRGMTQVELSRITGIAQPTLSRLEAAAHGVTTTTLKRIARAYDIALSVKFVKYSEFADEIATGKFDRPIASFEEDSIPKALAISLAATFGYAAGSSEGSSRLAAARAVVTNSGATFNLERFSAPPSSRDKPFSIQSQTPTGRTP